MNKSVLIIFAALSLTACKTKNVDPETLPKDISLKPENNLSQQADREVLNAMVKEIELMASLPCTDVSAWKAAPIGAKPCGGPSSYIAYPVSREKEILAKIETFNQKQRAFNEKYQLMSDCMMVMPPTEIKCVDGKAVLVNGNSTVSEVQ